MGGRARADELTDVTRLARRGRGGEHGGTKDGRLEALPPEWPKVKLIDVSGNYVPNLDQNLPNMASDPRWSKINLPALNLVAQRLPATKKSRTQTEVARNGSGARTALAKNGMRGAGHLPF